MGLEEARMRGGGLENGFWGGVKGFGVVWRWQMD